MFEQAPAETTLAALKGIFDNESEVRSTVEATIGAKQKALEKAAGYKPSGDIQKDMANKLKSKEEAARIQKELDYWNGVLASMPPTKESVTKQLTGKDVLPKTERRGEQPARAEDNGHGLTEAREAREKYVNEQRVSYDAETSRDLEVVNKRFNDELDNFKAGTHKGNLNLGKPLGILRAAGLNETEITLSPSVLAAKIKQHGLTTDELKDLASAIQSPMMVYEWGEKAKSTIIITELARANGEKITVAIGAERKGKTLEVNDVASIHGKSDSRLLDDFRKSTPKELTNTKLKYIADKEKVLNWLGLAAPKAALSQTDKDTAKVIQEFENPKLPDNNLRNEIKDFNGINESVREINKLKEDIAQAETETDTNPTEAQKEAGNYKKGHVKIQGFDISIEQPKGSVRRGTEETKPTVSKTEITTDDNELSKTQKEAIDSQKEAIDSQKEAIDSQKEANKKVASAFSSPSEFQSSSDYVENKINQYVKENGLNLDDFEGTDEWEKLYKEYQNSYPEYLQETVKQYDESNDTKRNEFDRNFQAADTSIDEIRGIVDDYAKTKKGKYKYKGSLQSAAPNAFVSISKEQFNALIDVLKKTGLAKDVIADVNKMREVFDKTVGKDTYRAFSKAVEIRNNAIMPREAKSVSDAQELIRPLANKPLTNKKLDMTATISNNSIGKLGSQSATDKSINPRLHAKAVANIDKLFENAEFDITHKDKDNRDGIENIHRLGSLMFDERTGDYIPVMITVKEFNNNRGNRIYTVEAVDIEVQKKSAGQLVGEQKETERQTPIADFNAKIQQLIETAKVSDENLHLPDNVRPMATSKGEVYGFVTEDGTVYIDPNRLNANTPIHEFGHLFWPTMPEAVRTEITGLLKQTPAWEKLSDNPAYANLKTDDQKADEIFNTILGNRGEKSIPAEEIMGRDITLIARITNAVNKFWEWVKSVFGSKEAKINRMADMTLGELLGGKKINLENEGKNANFAENKTHGKESETRMGNGRTMGSGSLRDLVESGPKGDRIEQTLETGNRRGSGGATESGLREGWNKNKFLAGLEVSARENGTWIDDIKTIADKRLMGGFENEPYIAKDGKNVIKVNNFAFLNDNDTDYEHTRDFNYFKDRLNGHNELFPQDEYKIIGFTKNSKGEVSVVLKQPYVRDSELASMGQIDDWMAENGFKKGKLSNGLDGYSNGKYELSDVKPQNVLVDTNGDLRFIDLDINPVYGKAEPAARFQTVPNSESQANTAAPEAKPGESVLDYAKRVSDRWGEKKKNNDVLAQTEITEAEYRDNIRSQSEKSPNVFIPVTEKEFNALIDVLKKTGLAKDVIADVNKMREVFDKTVGKDTYRAFSKAVEIRNNAIMPREAKSVSDAQELIRPLANKPLTNKKLDMTATISNNSIGKLGSQSATDKSINPRLHAKAVANIDKLFENAEFDVTHPDYKGNKDIEQIHRLGTLMFDEKTNDYIPVMITVKEFKNDLGNKIYSVESVDIEAQKNSAGQNSEKNQNWGLESSSKEVLSPIAEFLTKIQQLVETAKSSDGNLHLPDNVRPMATSKGEVYGFVTEDGTVYIDPNRLNANTPIHEFGHLFWPTMPKDLRREITGLLKQTPAWEKLSDNPAYANLKTDDQKADEIFNTILGNRGEKSIPAEEIMGRDITLIARITNAVNKFWEWVKSVFGSKEAKINRMADMTLGELLGGKKINLEENKKSLPLQNKIENNGVVDYKKLQEISDGIFERTTRIGRLNPKEETGRIAGGRTNVEATLVAGTAHSGNTIGKSSTYEAINKEAGKQKSALKSYAEEKEKRGEKIWYSEKDIQRIKEQSVEQHGGAEAEVYLMPDGEIIKIIEHSNTPLEFLDDRISLYNYLFPETAYELLGFTDNPYEPNLTSFIVRQKQVEGKTLLEQLKEIPQSERDAAEKRIKSVVAQKMYQDFGAEPAKAYNTYKNSNYYIRDLHWENIMTTENLLENPNTHLYVIDTIASLNDVKEDGGIREYGDYSLAKNKPENAARKDQIFLYDGLSEKEGLNLANSEKKR